MWVENVTLIREKNLGMKPERKSMLGRSKRRWEGNYQNEFKKNGMEVCGEIHVSQDRNQCQARVNLGFVKLLYYVNMTGNRTIAFIYCTACYTWVGRRVSTLQGHPYCPAVIKARTYRQPANTEEGTEH
jgi:hypothetical protein